MGLFKKKDKILDLTDYYNKRKQEMTSQTNNLGSTEPSTETKEVSPFGGFFGNTAPATKLEDVEMGNDEKRRRLALRLKNMTDKLEDVSNQIYHLQQRVELLEKKEETNRY